MRAALRRAPVRFVRQPATTPRGSAPRLRAGLAALPRRLRRVPWSASATCRAITPAQIDRLIAAFNPLEGRAIGVPDGARQARQPGAVRDPLRARDARRSAGDVGARHLIGEHADGGGRDRDRGRRERCSTSTRPRRLPRCRSARMSFERGAMRAAVPDLRRIARRAFHYLDSAATGQICRAAADALLALRDPEPRQRQARHLSARRGGDRSVRAGAPRRRRLSRRQRPGRGDRHLGHHARRSICSRMRSAHGLRRGRRDRALGARAPQQHRALAAAARARRRRASGCCR